jgi:hypothetical protein
VREGELDAGPSRRFAGDEIEAVTKHGARGRPTRDGRRCRSTRR